MYRLKKTIMSGWMAIIIFLFGIGYDVNLAATILASGFTIESDSTISAIQDIHRQEFYKSESQVQKAETTETQTFKIGSYKGRNSRRFLRVLESIEESVKILYYQMFFLIIQNVPIIGIILMIMKYIHNQDGQKSNRILRTNIKKIRCPFEYCS